jgi:hypothetical protein
MTREFLLEGWSYAADDINRASLLMSETFRITEIYQFDFSKADEETAYRMAGVAEHPGHWKEWVQKAGSAIYPRLDRGEGYFFLVPPDEQSGLLNLNLMRDSSITCVFTGIGEISSTHFSVSELDSIDGETPMTVSKMTFGMNETPGQSFTVFKLNKSGLSKYFHEPFIADFVLMTSVVPTPPEVTP